MKSTVFLAPLPMAAAAEMALELALLREECCRLAGEAAHASSVNQADLDDCDRLDEALAQAHTLVSSTLKQIRLSRKNRNRKS